MSRNKKETIYLLAAFLLLCLVSAYWQIGKRNFPSDAIRPVVVYFVYVTMLAIWCAAVRSRVTQRNMRVFLTAENICMLLGMTIRFIQEAFWHRFSIGALTSNDILLMRFSGYCTNIAFIVIPLLGLYASFGLAKTEDYRFDRKWYCLLIPAMGLVSMVLTNDLHHFTYRLAYDETQSVLYYHPNTGLYLVVAWAFSLILVRIFVLYRRSRAPDGFRFIRLVPLLFTSLIVLANMPYIAASFVVEFELLEQEATLFFLEVLVWESCILIGMVPVNTHYDEAFDRSTVAMQIVRGDGEPYLSSLDAPALTHGMFDMLKEHKTVRTPAGMEYHLQPISGGYSVWRNDISQTLAVIDELRHSSEELEQEGVLIRNELAIRSEEAAVKEQNRIYNRLVEEVGGQVSLIRSLLGKCECAADKTELLTQICIIGAFIKRRCHLRLVEQSDGIIPNAELALCYSELFGYLRETGVGAEVLWHTSEALAPELAIFSLDALEALLEYEQFNMRAIKVDIETAARFSIQVYFIDSSPQRGNPVDELQRINKDAYLVKWQKLMKGYQVTVGS